MGIQIVKTTPLLRTLFASSLLFAPSIILAAAEYAEDAYVEEQYVEETYQEEAYTEDSYVEESYQEESYVEEQYVEESYPEETYQEESYADDTDTEDAAPPMSREHTNLVNEARSSCQQWATESGLEGEDRTVFVDDCVYSQTGF